MCPHTRRPLHDHLYHLFHSSKVCIRLPIEALEADHELWYDSPYVTGNQILILSQMLPVHSFHDLDHRRITRSMTRDPALRQCSPSPPVLGPHFTSLLSRYDAARIERWLSSSATASANLPTATLGQHDDLPSDIEVDYGDSNLHTSLYSGDGKGQEHTQSMLELRMSITFDRQLNGLSLPVLERFQNQYASYPRNLWSLFLNICVFIKWHDSRMLFLHPFLWDDFIRFASRPPIISAQVIRKAGSPDALDVLQRYDRDVRAPKFVSNIVNRQTIEEVLCVDVGLTNQLLAHYLGLENRRLQRSCDREFEDILQNAIMADMELEEPNGE